MRRTKAVFFDVDFTLIYPGPMFRGEGYCQFCEKHGMRVDAGRFEQGLRVAAAVLDGQDGVLYDPELFVRYTAAIIEHMGGTGSAVDGCAREIYEEWAACRHFLMYDDVTPALRSLHAEGIKLGLISNTHRSLEIFQSHFELDGLIAAAVSSSEHGYMKPHPSIFEAALRLVGVESADALMVGDNLKHDVEGARRAGMRAALLVREGVAPSGIDGVPVISTLADLPLHL